MKYNEIYVCGACHTYDFSHLTSARLIQLHRALKHNVEKEINIDFVSYDGVTMIINWL
jgi:hypothetical protein